VRTKGNSLKIKLEEQFMSLLNDRQLSRIARQLVEELERREEKRERMKRAGMQSRRERLSESPLKSRIRGVIREMVEGGERAVVEVILDLGAIKGEDVRTYTDPKTGPGNSFNWLVSRPLGEVKRAAEEMLKELGVEGAVAVKFLDGKNARTQDPVNKEKFPAYFSEATGEGGDKTVGFYVEIAGVSSKQVSSNRDFMGTLDQVFADSGKVPTTRNLYQYKVK
jgi:hypothetical protein